jgi:uncharacterized protein (TIGR00730 family)
MKTITIFSSSKENLRDVYKENVTRIITNLNLNKYKIAYGGGSTGLMGIIRKQWKGELISSNVEKFVETGFTDTFVFDNMVDRQKKLVELGDCYLIFPGGIGTHYEMLEVITKNDIKESNKPIFILNTDGIFDCLINHLEKLKKEGFITRSFEELNIYITSDPDILINIIDNFTY